MLFIFQVVLSTGSFNGTGFTFESCRGECSQALKKCQSYIFQVSEVAWLT